MRQSAAGLVLVVCFAFTDSVCQAQANSPRNAAPAQTLCSYLPKAEAESILGEPLVQQAASASLCRYIQNGYAGGTGPNNKQLSLAIAHSASPNVEGVNSRRTSIARDPALAGVAVRDVTDFADAALWSWTAGWGPRGHARRCAPGVARISQIAPILGQFAQIAGQVAASEEEDQLRESLDGPPEAERMTWDGMNKVLGFVRPAQGRPPEMPQYLTIRGTISRVDVSPPRGFGALGECLVSRIGRAAVECVRDVLWAI